MVRLSTHRISAVICVLLLARAVYWFGTGRQASASAFEIGLAAAGGVVGLLGAIWFWYRSRRNVAGPSGK
jgi:hypothetical protein